ncbi:MAG TPA: hypothetical protein VGM19_00795 [Armatimonadota bacterium]
MTCLAAASLWGAGLAPARAAVSRPPADVPSVTLSGPAQGAPSGPRVDIVATAAGWALSPSLVIINPYAVPWRITVDSAAPQLVGGTARIARSRVQSRDVQTGTGWVSLGGTQQNQAGQYWVELQFRANVLLTDPPGDYVAAALISYQLLDGSGTKGSLPIQLHIIVPELFSLSLTPPTLDFGLSEGNLEGWIYSSEANLRVQTNLKFQLTVTTGEDVTLPGVHKIPTCLRLRQPVSTGTLWATWGDLGGDAHGQATPPWLTPRDTGSPWPGSIAGIGTGGTVTGTGDNQIGIMGALYRSGVYDDAGTYQGDLKITVSAIPW